MSSKYTRATVFISSRVQRKRSWKLIFRVSCLKLWKFLSELNFWQFLNWNNRNIKTFAFGDKSFKTFKDDWSFFGINFFILKSFASCQNKNTNTMLFLNNFHNSNFLILLAKFSNLNVLIKLKAGNFKPVATFSKISYLAVETVALRKLSS